MSSNGADVGWNEVAPNPNGAAGSACRAIQFYSTGGSDQYDLHVHDNFIHHTCCDGINFATVNPDAGVVEAYNNVVWHVGTGPDPSNGSSNYSCVLTGASATRTTPVELYNNTFYDCGSRGGNDSGAIAPSTSTRMRNNIVYQVSGEHYKNPNAGGQLSGSNNAWFGLTESVPAGLTAGLTANPQFINTSTPDFHLTNPGSSMINAGATINGLLTDVDGATRPQGANYDVGAYEAHTGSPSGPAAPTLISVVPIP